MNVTFLPGEKGPKTVPFDIIDDSLVESKEFYYVNFVSSSSPAVKFSQPTVINIEDNDGMLVAGFLVESGLNWGGERKKFAVVLFYKWKFMEMFYRHSESKKKFLRIVSISSLIVYFFTQRLLLDFLNLSMRYLKIGRLLLMCR